MGRKRKIRRRSLLPVDILGEVAYVDTVGLELPRKIPEELFQRLDKSLGKNVAGKRRSKREKVFTANGFWKYNYFVQQPDAVDMNNLASGAKACNARLLEVHVALDLLTDTFNDARLLQSYFEAMYLPSGRLKTPVEFRGRRSTQTAYYNKGTRKGTELKFYSDRPSKAAGSPCLHIEWRVVGTVALRNAGLGSIEATRELNFRKFCDHRLSLWRAPSAAELVATHQKNARQKTRVPVPLSVSETKVNTLLRSALSEQGGVVAQNLLLALEKEERAYMLRPKRLFTSEPHAWALPPETNALWASL